MKAEFDNKISFTQWIIEAKTAPLDVIDKMQIFVNHWTNKRSDLNSTEIENLYGEFRSAFSENMLMEDEFARRGNLYTNGKFHYFTTIFDDDNTRLNDFKNVSIQKFNDVSQATKDSEKDLMIAFRQFSRKNNMMVIFFYSF